MQERDLRSLRGAVSAAQITLDKVAVLAGLGNAGARGSTLLSVARRLECERRTREACFPGGGFDEPAWGVLLALYMASIIPPSNVRFCCYVAEPDGPPGHFQSLRLTPVPGSAADCRSHLREIDGVRGKTESDQGARQC